MSAAPTRRYDGLPPMRRQYVHLSIDRATARAVGRRKARAAVAPRAGIAFYAGNDKVRLADRVPPQFIAPAEAE